MFIKKTTTTTNSNKYEFGKFSFIIEESHQMQTENTFVLINEG